MARKNIELGVIPTGQGGDTFRSAMTKVNDMTQELYDKTAGSQPGATKNRPDAELLARANHTGAQLASTVSDFSPAVKSVVGAYGVGSLDNMPFAGVNLNPDTYRTGGYVAGQFNLSQFWTMTGTLITQAGTNNGTGSQQFSDWSSGRIYSRCMQGGTWGAWKPLIATGDYGVGAVSLAACNDANVIEATGDLLLHPGTLNGPTPGIYGTIRTTFYERSSGNFTQLAIATNGVGMFYRGCINGSVQPWMRINEESITNGNGTAVKFSDGTMICWHTSGAVRTTSNQVSAGVFLGEAEIFTFPVPFVTIGAVMPTVAYSATGYCWASVGEGNNPYQCRIVAFSHTNNAQYQAKYFAVGRWR